MTESSDNAEQKNTQENGYPAHNNENDINFIGKFD